MGTIQLGEMIDSRKKEIKGSNEKGKKRER
jgi:hypothetical protein